MGLLVRRVAGIAIVLIVWEIAGRRLGEALLAPPSLVLPAYLDLLRQGDMLRELALSLRQMLAGFLLACVTGMPLGIAMGRSSIVDRIAHPWVSMFVVTSIAALVPLFIMLLGTGFVFRVTIVYLATVWYVVLTVYQGARGVDPRLIAAGVSFGASPSQVFWKILLPALFPFLITAARIGLVHSLRGMIVAEIFVIIGFGGLIQRSGLLVSTAPMLCLLLTIMAVSLIANRLLYLAGARLAPWYEARTANS